MTSPLLILYCYRILIFYVHTMSCFRTNCAQKLCGSYRTYVIYDLYLFDFISRNDLFLPFMHNLRIFFYRNVYNDFRHLLSLKPKQFKAGHKNVCRAARGRSKTFNSCSNAVYSLSISQALVHTPPHVLFLQDSKWFVLQSGAFGVLSILTCLIYAKTRNQTDYYAY